MEEALTQLALAEQQRPTDARVRNDHGYALLLAGRYAEARARFQTALELGERERAAANLVLALLAGGDLTEADAAARRLGLDDSTQARLRSQAAQLRPRS
jgi:Flp pilus assembly protein TadD